MPSQPLVHGSYRRWRELRLAILNRDNWRCYVCGGKASTVDHVVSRKLGGGNAMVNLRACCVKHNSAKRDRPPTVPTVSRVW